jgi:hydrogenase nickel incorporation protein HypB
MCGTCGCGSEATVTVTVIDREEGGAAPEGAAHDHGHDHHHHHHHEHHSHADSHSHSYEHHAHDHDHDHSHEHHAHDHDHVHAQHSHDHHHHADDHGHDHRHDDDHHRADHGHADHGHLNHGPAAGQPRNIIELEAQVFAKNDALAAKNRAWFAGREILAVNLVSSPGAGKTMLLERTIRDLGKELPLFVLEGDQATANDGARIRAAGAPVVQINTGTGCHLEADMVARGLMELKPQAGAVVLIENVGNLVCPAMFDLGERAKIAVLSVTEGEDKPLKYPHMFRAAEVMILNKIDLLPYVDFDAERAIAYAREVNPDITILRVSARSGEGLDGWYDWLRRELTAAREASLI